MADTTKKRKMLNPILMKELKLGARSIRLPLTVMFYDIVLAIVAVIAILIAAASGGSGGGMDYSGFLYIYEVIGWIQIGIMLLIVPILTAGTVSGEREKQTLEIMLTTPKKPMSIVWGKLLAALSNFMIFIISSVPIMAIAFVLGGMNWLSLIGYIFMMIVLAIYIGSVGICCSCTFKKTIVSIVMTFVIEFALFIIPVAVFGGLMGVGAIAYESIYRDVVAPPNPNFGLLPMIMIGNPLTGFLDYMLRAIDAPSLAAMMKDADIFGVIMPILAKAWIPMNVVVCGAISYFFLWLAAKKLNPIRKQKKRKQPQNAAPVMPAAGTPVQQAQPSPQLYKPVQPDSGQDITEELIQPNVTGMASEQMENNIGNNMENNIGNNMENNIGKTEE